MTSAPAGDNLPAGNHFDTLIIGAGMSGLAAGIRLAHFGQNVCILERHTTIGGLNSFYRLGGRNFDVGLHAVTNFAVPGTKRGPLARIMRQLRLSWDDFALCEQWGSRISFPGTQLRFSNDLELLKSEITRTFPTQIDGFNRLVAELPEYEQLATAATESAREYVGRYVSDPLLVEMLLCPLMYYGNAREQDMDVAQFCIMFRSLYLEGFGRPRAGVRVILKTLTRRYKELGGKLWLRCGVRRLHAESGQIARVELDDSRVLTAKRILSSAGCHETYRMCGTDTSAAGPPGVLSFVEISNVLDCQPAELGCRDTIVFFSDHVPFVWSVPQDDVDLGSGVICAPNNYAFAEPLPEGTIRVTALANYARWRAFGPAEYQARKVHWQQAVLAAAVRHVPDFRAHIVAGDMFTPTTVQRFTGHDHGAVYGAVKKRYDGTTPWNNLFLCGTDQGFVGIVGALVSGIAMANLHCLAGGGGN